MKRFVISKIMGVIMIVTIIGLASFASMAKDVAVP